MHQCQIPSSPTANPVPDCASQALFFPDLGPRKVVADFSGGDLSSDGGVRWLRQVDQGLDILGILWLSGGRMGKI